MGRWVACSVFLAACSFNPGGAPNDGRIIDTPTQKDVPAEPDPDATACFGTGLGLNLCFTTLPTMPYEPASDVTITNDAVDTINCSQEPTFSAYCVIAGTDVTIDNGTSLVVNGTRPLVIIATGTLKVRGTIDVGSHIHVGRSGAGAQVGCTDGTTPAGDGGGYGGTFGTAGGTGGEAGGMPSMPATVTAIAGGCGGSDGAGGNAGAGGPGGGIAYLIAGTEIDMIGMLDASGAGGSAAAVAGDDGGGGGGSGGLIAFDSPLVMFGANAKVFANGGGGGEGNEGSKGGHDGRDPTTPTMAASGGTNGGNGGNGGDGAINTQTGHDGFDKMTGGTAGGGGGGGGVGVIRVFQSPLQIDGNISPPPT